jgi:hypothetical protein
MSKGNDSLSGPSTVQALETRDMGELISTGRASPARAHRPLDMWLSRLAQIAMCITPLLLTVWAVRFYHQQERSEARAIIFRTYERWDSVYDPEGRLWDDQFRNAASQLTGRDQQAMHAALKPLVVAREAKEVTVASADPWLKDLVGPKHATSDEALQDACTKCHVSIVNVLNLFESIRETYVTSDVSARRILDEGYRETMAKRLKQLEPFIIAYRELNQSPHAWAPLDELIKTGNWGR